MYSSPSHSNLLELRKFVAPEYVFGKDARKLASQYCLKLGVRKLFVATDSNMMESTFFKELLKDLEETNIEFVCFSDISPNPRDYEVMQGAEVYKENKCNMLLAFGGGSVIDCAKGIGIVSTNHSHISSFVGVDKISRPMPPLISIPTTGGTSADVSQFTIINNTTYKYKMTIISKALISDLALIDPVLLSTMDSYLGACTGMDALSHAFEAYVSNASSPVTDLYALEAIKILHSDLKKSIDKPLDIELRGSVMLASLYAGLSFSNASLGCVHSLAHSLGGFLDLAHGECNAILLPHVVNYNYKSAEDKYQLIANAVGIDTRGLESKLIQKYLVDYLFGLKEDLAIRASLKERGVSIDLTPVLASKAINDPCNATNPKVPTQKDLQLIYNEAF